MSAFVCMYVYVCVRACFACIHVSAPCACLVPTEANSEHDRRQPNVRLEPRPGQLT